MSITPEQKKRRFRELTRDDRIRTASEFAKELQQPLLPFTIEVQENPRRAGTRQAEAAK
jgi:hypothetical protein